MHVSVSSIKFTEARPASFFFFNDTATTEIYTLSLHDALPISSREGAQSHPRGRTGPRRGPRRSSRSEEHTSELQSLTNLVCRLLLEKKKVLVPRDWQSASNDFITETLYWASNDTAMM